MTADELLERSSSRLLTEYQLLFGIQGEEQELRQDGLTPDEIADAIDSRGEVEIERDEPTLLDRLLPEEQAAERRMRRIEAELADEAAEDDEGD